jgi:hypothetical protein
MSRVRVRGIYATALTATFETVVQASPAIAERFERSFPDDPPEAAIETTSDRQGVGVHGVPSAVESVAGDLGAVARDALVWQATLPRGAVYAGEVTETLGGGALVDCGDGTGFLPYSKTARHVEEGDRLRVQVSEPRPPWGEGRPVLDTTVRMQGGFADLVRGGSRGGNGPELAEILPVDPPEGWGIDWAPAADDAGLDALGDTLRSLGERATALDEAFTDVPAPGEVAPHTYWAGEATRWVWFGRESRFALDARRREVVPTMAGHHRTKAATNAASTAVDFVEAVCDDIASGDPRGRDDTAPGDGDTDNTAASDEHADESEDIDSEAFPFGAVVGQFGPRTGDTVGIGHGKPEGRRIDLGPGEVTDIDGETVTVERELSGGGTYDALGVAKQAGDIATTKFREGRWWYPTVYRGADGERRGTYVNVCTPVEVFPDEIRYVDLHVDVVKRPDGTVERVDDDELDAAVDAGLVGEQLAEKARRVAAAVERAM